MHLNSLVLLPVASLQLIREAGNSGGSMALPQGPGKRLADNKGQLSGKCNLKSSINIDVLVAKS